uniref:Uncharacterized protein n=1 Tax=Tanacetum cinerariifolium TaxID=118510 RepID=A0A699GVV5_TANCI|nr:hypothetical protein [Tanacetum cinerariifolium]
MKFFLMQKLAESRHFMNHMRKEVEIVRGCIGQLTAVIAELQAMDDQDEVHDSLLAAKDAKHGEETKLTTLNEVIAEALADIETLETDVEILDGENNDCEPYWLFFALMPPEFPIRRLKALKFSYLKTDKMKVVFDQARREEASLKALMRDVYCSLRVSLSKKRRLATELEALEDQGDAVRVLENMKEIVSRDSVTLDLEQLLAHAQFELDLKDGYLVDVGEKAWVLVMVADLFGVC